MVDLRDRGQFLNFAGLFEGGLVIVAIVLGWLMGIHPLEWLSLDPRAVVWGIAAALPMFGLFWMSQFVSFGPLSRINRFLIEMLGPSLDACRWYDLVLLAGLAGLGEEMLFRGLLHPWFGQWGPVAGLLFSNLLFGLVHFITPTYALLAGLMGVYLGLLLDLEILLGLSDERNLLIPVVTHAFYDYLAFLVVLRTYRKERDTQQFSNVNIQDNER